MRLEAKILNDYVSNTPEDFVLAIIVTLYSSFKVFHCKNKWTLRLEHPVVTVSDSHVNRIFELKQVDSTIIPEDYTD